MVVPDGSPAPAPAGADALAAAVSERKPDAVFVFTDDSEAADFWENRLAAEGRSVFSSRAFFGNAPSTRKADVEAATALFFLARCDRIVSVSEALPALVASAIGGAEWVRPDGRMNSVGSFPAWLVPLSVRGSMEVTRSASGPSWSAP